MHSESCLSLASALHPMVFFYGSYTRHPPSPHMQAPVKHRPLKLLICSSANRSLVAEQEDQGIESGTASGARISRRNACCTTRRLLSCPDLVLLFSSSCDWRQSRKLPCHPRSSSEFLPTCPATPFSGPLIFYTPSFGPGIRSFFCHT